MKVLIDNGSGYVDYTRYVAEGSLVVTDDINVPTLTDFVLINLDPSFIVPHRASYVRIVSEVNTPKVLATGFVTNEPTRQFLGQSRSAGVARGYGAYAYRIQVSSDEWLMNVKSVPYIPAFVNQTQGQILTKLATALTPGFYDTSQIEDGDLIPYFPYDPERNWSDIAKEFADSIRYRYKVLDRVIYFVPFGDEDLGIEYDDTVYEAGFDPRALKSDVLSVPPVNDAIVVGAVEPQTSWDSHYIGDGFTGDFSLRHKIFEGDTSLLLQEDWTETSFSQQSNNVWTFTDPGLNFSVDGSLNVDGGTGLGNSYIEAVNGLELGGALNLQHGEFVFIDTCEGVVGGVYDGVARQRSNCIAGFNLTTPSVTVGSVSGASGINIQPVAFGSLVGPVIVSQKNHHYFLQTVLFGRRWDRQDSIYRSILGTSYGGQQLSANGTIVFIISDIDLSAPGNPTVTKYVVDDVSLQSFGTYIPINSSNLNLVLNYTLLAFPPQCMLMVRSISGASGGQLPTLPSTLSPEVGYVVGFGLDNQAATIGVAGDVNLLQFYSDSLPGVGARIRLKSWQAQQSIARVRDSAAIASEAVIVGDDGVRMALLTSLRPQPRTSEECELAAAAAILDRKTTQFQGSYTVMDYFWGWAPATFVSGAFKYQLAVALGLAVADDNSANWADRLGLGRGLRLAEGHIANNDVVLVSDEFDVADQTLGSNWVAVTGAFKIESQQVRGDVAAGGFGRAYYNKPLPDLAQWSQCRIATASLTGTIQGIGCEVRVDSTAKTGYSLRVLTTGAAKSCQILRLTSAAGATQVAVLTLTSLLVGDIFRIEAAGSKVEVFQNGVLILTYTDPAPFTVGSFAGITSSGNQTGVLTADSFAAGVLIPVDAIRTPQLNLQLSDYMSLVDAFGKTLV
jgi:hypothetical protein